MKQAKKETNPIKSFAQFMFIVYIFVMFMFSFQSDLVKYTEYVFILFALVVVIYIVSTRTLILAKEHFYLLAFCLISLLTSVWAINFNTAFNSSISLFILVIMSILVYQIFDKEEVDILLKAVFYAGIALVILTLINAGFGNYFDAILSGKRLGGAMNAPNTFGVYCSISFVLGLYLLKDKKIFHTIMLLILFSGILASGSRNAFIITAIGSFVAMLFAFKNMTSKEKVFMIILVLILLLALYLFGFFNNIFSRMENLGGSSDIQDIEDPSLQSRLFMFTFGLENFIYKPIFGYGINNAQFLLEEYFARTYLHNNYIELLVDVGAVGFFFYYINHISLMKSLFKQRSGKLEIPEILFTIFIVLLVADISIVYYYNKLTYIVLTMGMIANKESSKQTKGEISQ